ncbi:MAG: hypothetical protein HY923_09705 [Elusimicrobia bacterium]|nr:hypothetical protein [Elusimicrobiota bacterium]
MNPFKLNRAEKKIEAEVLRGEWKSVDPERFKRISVAIARARKDAVISLRLNSEDLAAFKKKAKAAGVPYQSLIAELIHYHATH